MGEEPGNVKWRGFDLGHRAALQTASRGFDLGHRATLQTASRGFDLGHRATLQTASRGFDLGHRATLLCRQLHALLLRGLRPCNVSPVSAITHLVSHMCLRLWHVYQVCDHLHVSAAVACLPSLRSLTYNNNKNVCLGLVCDQTPVSAAACTWRDVARE